MKATAKDVMYTKFNTLSPQMSTGEAVKIFREAGEKEQRKIFGMMVTDDHGRLIGMLSMYDILLLIRPKHFIFGV